MNTIPLEHEIAQKCSEKQLNGTNFIITKCKKFCCKKQSQWFFNWTWIWRRIAIFFDDS